MQDQQRFIMVSPAPGFTNRVMTRLAERERARARRRAMIGSALLVGTVCALMAFALAPIVPIAWIVLTKPQVIVVSWSVFQTLACWVGTLLDVLWNVANVLAANLDPLQTLMGALGVFAMTLLWTRVATGSFQLSLNYTRGLGK